MLLRIAAEEPIAENRKLAAIRQLHTIGGTTRFAESRPIAEIRAIGPATDGETVMRFGIFGLLAALAVGMITVTGDVSTADAQVCRKNYYRCDLNRGGRIDPANPNCCWSPLAGPPSRSCPRNFYRCDLNAGGRIDPKHPGCCWNLR